MFLFCLFGFMKCFCSSVVGVYCRFLHWLPFFSGTHCSLFCLEILQFSLSLTGCTPMSKLESQSNINCWFGRHATLLACVCVCVYVCMHVYVFTYVFLCEHTCVHTHKCHCGVCVCVRERERKRERKPPLCTEA